MVKDNRIKSNTDVKRTIIESMIIQGLICLIIYSGIFVIKNNNYVFSERIIKKTKSVLSYDIDFIEMFNRGIKYLQNSYNFQVENISQDDENDKDKNTKAINEKENRDNKDEGQVKKNEGEKQSKENKNNSSKELSQMEQDAQYLKEKYNLILPLKGRVSSEFGDRNDDNPIVTREHKGIDIAAKKGTKIKAAMDGVVDISTTSSSYGKYVEIVNNDVKTLYAHCNKLYVKKGDKIKKGQEIAEVGETRRSNTDPIYILRLKLVNDILIQEWF